ncbi:hypothetical protein ABR39_00685 [Enterobacter genomosp. O]|jgi:hypothetical protein|nr:hypothetical protein ABR39_00685 [Enterobacter genomosp. O]
MKGQSHLPLPAFFITGGMNPLALTAWIKRVFLDLRPMLIAGELRTERNRACSSEEQALAGSDI